MGDVPGWCKFIAPPFSEEQIMNGISSNRRRKFRRRLASCAVGGSVALSSAMCYAADAFDSASDPVYADGWQAGDNGGHGFTPWNFDNDPGPSPFHAIDDGLRSGTHYSNPFNNISPALDIGDAPVGTNFTTPGPGLA